MANSSSRPPPGGGTWATPHDWATHRTTITALYEGQNMTLKKIMQTMEADHKFFATERMYKSRLKQWGLRKNYRYEEVNEIIRQQQSTRPATATGARSSGAPVAAAGSRIRKGTGRRVRPYRKQPDNTPAPIIVRYGQQRVRRPSAVSVLQRLTPPPTGIGCRAPSPPGSPEISILFPLTPPADLYYPEECSFHIQRYCAGAFEKGIWALETPGWMNTNRSVVDWFNRMALARGALSGGRTQQGFKLLQLCFDEYKDMILTQDPRLMLYTTVSLFLLVGYPEVVSMLMKYITRLSKILQGPFHPLHQIMAALDQMGLEKMQDNARLIFDAQIAEFARYLPPENEVLQSMAVFSIRNLAVTGLIDTDVAQAKLLALPRSADNGRISMATAQVLMMGGRYKEARQVVEELLASGTNRSRTLAGAFDTLFLICRYEGEEQTIRDASNRRINFCLETFGTDNDWTVDACNDYETYLREIGDVEGASKVFSSFGVNMERLTEGVAELEIK
ncbi:hypothetical protein PFICI_14878 [Pestalotiopsis fici W106-1]|uniref:Clr5 domain-containing protein n=1 Tax=Pestalotiopsis fici (strain W106-1 / CGMCC3.15140) TaxID=1229662 RepID=W3WHB8_PESFW|nr:uncharacterized protein PFICI_14878 [Pestalotiopsis fici W106-1]ETS73273.1 hypothetical protein PFICI_14878 [Pestalotiopsis fici W106-1]